MISTPDAASNPAEQSTQHLCPERMQALLDSSWDILSLLDEEGRLIYNSPAAQRLHGFEPSEMAGHNTFEFFHPEDAHEVQRVFAQCLARPGLPVQVQYRYARKDGSWIWMEAVAVNRLNSPTIRAIVVNSRDITERKIRENELRRINRLYDMLRHLNQSLMQIQTREGLFQEICSIVVDRGDFQLAWIGWVDPETHRVVPIASAGKAVDFLEGLSISTEDLPEGRGPTGSCIREGRSKICQDTLSDPALMPWRSGLEKFGLRASVSIPIKVQTKVAGALAVFAAEPNVFQEQEVALLEEASAQISFGLNHIASEEQRRRLETELIQTQKMESLGSLAGGVAHDMNNVLGAILGLASANLETQPINTPVYRAFETIVKAAVRGGNMVKSLLSFARQSPAETRQLDLNALLREEVQLLERTTLAKIRLRLEFADDLKPIRGDASALTHAFMNLCVNAVDAMPENGILTLRTRNVDTEWIEIQVQDTGTGMSKAVLEKALDPFFTTKAQGKGTGLGLSIVYSTVKAHRGQMEIESQPALGTCVKIRFPSCETERSEATQERQIQMFHPSLNLLLVDDDDLIACAMRSVTDALGHRLVVADCGESAIAKLESGYRPDVIILDLNMPGMGGIGTLPQVRAICPDLPVLLATGRIDQRALDFQRTNTNVQLLSKPFDLKELQHHLESIKKA